MRTPSISLKEKDLPLKQCGHRRGKRLNVVIKEELLLDHHDGILPHMVLRKRQMRVQPLLYKIS